MRLPELTVILLLTFALMACEKRSPITAGTIVSQAELLLPEHIIISAGEVLSSTSVEDQELETYNSQLKFQLYYTQSTYVGVGNIEDIPEFAESASVGVTRSLSAEVRSVLQNNRWVHDIKFPESFEPGQIKSQLEETFGSEFVMQGSEEAKKLLAAQEEKKRQAAEEEKKRRDEQEREQERLRQTQLDEQSRVENEDFEQVLNARRLKRNKEDISKILSILGSDKDIAFEARDPYKTKLNLRSFTLHKGESVNFLRWDNGLKRVFSGLNYHAEDPSVLVMLAGAKGVKSTHDERILTLQLTRSGKYLVGDYRPSGSKTEFEVKSRQLDVDDWLSH